MDKVFARAKEIVSPSKPVYVYGYGDVGDVLVSYLRNDIDSDEALERLENLHITYERDRAKQK